MEETNFNNRFEAPYNEKLLADNYLKEHDYEKSLKHYAKALLAVKVLSSDKEIKPDKLQSYMLEVYVPSSLNVSFIHYKNREYDKTILYCNNVLEIQNKNTKALYRKAMSLIKLGNLEESKEIILKLDDLIGNTNELSFLKESYENEKKELIDKRAKFFSKAVNGYLKSNEIEFQETLGFFDKSRIYITTFLKNIYNLVFCKKRIISKLK